MRQPVIRNFVTGPKGGLYYIGPSGRKVYARKTARIPKAPRMS